jgi:diguanylate cyclase (GGDEF)-like protein
VVLPDTDQRGAQLVAANMQESVDNLRIENSTTIGLYATISVGVATAVPNDGSAQRLLQGADQALYMAKENGRNRIELFRGNSDLPGESDVSMRLKISARLRRAFQMKPQGSD